MTKKDFYDNKKSVTMIKADVAKIEFVDPKVNSTILKDNLIYLSNFISIIIVIG